MHGKTGPSVATTVCSTWSGEPSIETKNCPRWSGGPTVAGDNLRHDISHDNSIIMCSGARKIIFLILIIWVPNKNFIEA